MKFSSHYDFIVVIFVQYDSKVVIDKINSVYNIGYWHPTKPRNKMSTTFHSHRWKVIAPRWSHLSKRNEKFLFSPRRQIINQQLICPISLFTAEEEFLFTIKQAEGGPYLFLIHWEVEASVTILGDLLDFSKPSATIIFPKSPTFLGNFCKGVKNL